MRPGLASSGGRKSLDVRGGPIRSPASSQASCRPRPVAASQVSLILRDRVEVAGDDDGAARRESRNASRDPLCRVDLPLPAAEREVRVEDVKPTAGLAVVKARPGDDSGDVAPPADSGRPVGGREPEGAGRDRDQYLAPIEDRRVLAESGAAVEPAVGTEPAVAGERGRQVLHLLVERLLQTRHIRGEPLDRLRHQRAPVHPAVVAVVAAGRADVEGHDAERHRGLVLSARGRGGGGR